MKVFFIGAVHFSKRCLEELIRLKVEVVGVCTLSESAFNSDHFDLSSIAKEHSIPVRSSPDVGSEDTLKWIRGLEPDVIFCFGWSKMIPDSVLTLTPLGAIGFHPASLPQNRGRHPLIWALALGLSETASTFFFMDAGADSGDLLSQEPVPILRSDDAGSLYERVTDVALGQIRDFTPRLAAGIFDRQSQDHANANYWRGRGTRDGCIDWRMAATSIDSLVRALSKPYIGAHFEYKNQIIKVWKSEVVPKAPINMEPGKVLEVDESGILIKSGIGAIRLKEIDPPISLEVGNYL
ncbi:MAG: formyltransferase family protein [Gammaproteobacteria bacterium]